MKLSLEQYGITYTIKETRDDLNISEVMEHIVSLLLAAGFSKETIDKELAKW